MRPELWPDVERLFHAAMEQPSEARSMFLKEVCGEDTELRQCVELLVASDAQAGSLLEPSLSSDLAQALSEHRLLLGRQYGPYRILSLIGAGGMGEVYRAHDTKLGRDVAIKALPLEFASDLDRVARLRREARTLASLNHPNIAVIYAFEESDVDYLVLELIEGHALKGPLRVKEALRVAEQLAAAIEAAHDKEIIHRDLKPANVRVMPNGIVKVFDFGLASLTCDDDRRGDWPADATTSIENTRSGCVLGTPGYMSPEQALGRTVDARTDIWAFGCIVYELLAGKPAFPGKTPPDRITAELKGEPDWQALPRRTPVRIRRLLRHCLQRDPAQRLSNILEARKIISGTERRPGRWIWAASAAALLTCFALATFWLSNRVPRPYDRSSWAQLTRFPDPVSQPALSPDGRMIAFVRSPRTDPAVGQVYIKRIPDGEAVELTHDNLRKGNPAFSPDGAAVAYSTIDAQFHWDTWIVPVAGGEPRRWLQNAGGLFWAGPQHVLFSEITNAPIMRIVAAREDGTGRHAVYLPVNDRGMAERAVPSPDRKWVLVAEVGAYGNWEQCRIVPMDGRSPGHLVGPPGAPCTFGAWSADGKWVYLTSKAGGLFHIWRQRFPHGQLEQLTSGPTEEEGVALTPDGRSLITAVSLANSSLWIHDPRGERQISVLEGNAAYPKFLPDGKRLAYRIVKSVPRFGTNRDPGEVWAADLLSGHSERIAPGFDVLDYDISRDGTQIVMEAPDSDGRPRLWLAPLDRRQPPRQIPHVEGRKALFSPDGDIFFRHVEGASSFLYRVRPDGTVLRKAFQQTVLSPSRISSDGHWIEIWGPGPRGDPPVVQVVPIGGGPPLMIGSNTLLEWSSSGDSLWITAGPIREGVTYVVPLPRGKVLPTIPKAGFRSEDQVASLPGARRIDAAAAPGPNIGVYAFIRQTTQRNLYRIPIQ